MRLTDDNIVRFYDGELVVLNRDGKHDLWYYDSRCKRIRWVWFNSRECTVVKREDGYTQNVREIFQNRHVMFTRIKDYRQYTKEHYSLRCVK